jgi:hypothetical protein
MEKRETLIIGLRGKLQWLSPELAVCCSCSVVFNIQLRCLLVERMGYNTWYYGIPCPNCGEKVAITQEWVLKEVQEQSQMEWERITKPLEMKH